MLLNHMKRTDYPINLRLRNTERFPVVLLAENHFDIGLFRIEGDQDSVRFRLRIALLKARAILALNRKNSRIRCR